MFKKSDLELGDVVVDRRGVAAMVAKVHSHTGNILLSNEGFMPLFCFDDDLLCGANGGGRNDSEFDIMRVYRSYVGWGWGFTGKLRRLSELESDSKFCIFDRDSDRSVEIDGKTYRMVDVKRALAHEDVKSLEEEDDHEF